MKFLLTVSTVVNEEDLGSVMAFIHNRSNVRDLSLSPAQEEQPLLASPHHSHKDKPKKKMTCRQMILRELAGGPAKSGALSKVGVANGFGASTAYTTLTGMVKNGEVERAYGGIYSLVKNDRAQGA